MKIHEFAGLPSKIGREYGQTFFDIIHNNVNILVRRNGYSPLPTNTMIFKEWIDTQEKLIESEWPWLLEEIMGVSLGSGIAYDELLLLNLRAWQYESLSSTVATACSSMAVSLLDGTIANTGALDDGDYYCGMVKIIPEHGYRFMTFPLAGTVWGNRGINSAGLCIGESSLVNSGLQRLPGTICGDIALRVILQTCATVAEVRSFCKHHPFTLNLVCSDRNGDVFCAHQTTAGLFEMTAEMPCVMTNHIFDDQIRFLLHLNGAADFFESSCTRLRRGRLLDFARLSNGKCSAEDVRDFIVDRLNGALSSACPAGNIVMTYANSQAEPGVMWIAEPHATLSETWERHIL